MSQGHVFMSSYHRQNFITSSLGHKQLTLKISWQSVHKFSIYVNSSMDSSSITRVGQRPVLTLKGSMVVVYYSIKGIWRLG